MATALPAGLAVLSPSAADDKDGIACRAQVAADHGCGCSRTWSTRRPRIRVGATPDQRAMFGSGSGTVTPLPDAEAVIDAMEEGRSTAAPCAPATPTSPAIDSSSSTTISSLVPSQVVVPLIGTAQATPAVQAVLDAVSSTLDTTALRDAAGQGRAGRRRPGRGRRPVAARQRAG